MKTLITLACIATLCACTHNGNVSSHSDKRDNSVGISNESGNTEIYGSIGASSTISSK